MRLFTATMAAAGALLVASSAVAQDVTLRFQHFISPNGSVPAFFMTPWAEKVAEESDGRIEIEIYPAMQLGGAPPALFDQIRDNVIDGGWTIPSYTPGRFPGVEVFELPFMTSTSAEASSIALWNFYEKYLTEEFADVHVLGIHVHGPGVVHLNDESIETLADFDGLKLRTPTRVTSQILESLGAEPIGMPVPQLPEAVSTGVVDGGVIPWEIVPALRMHELADSHTQFGGDRALYNTVFIWAMNKDVYEGLDPELQAVIDANTGVSTSAWAGRAMDEGDVLGEETTAGTGNTIVTLDDAEIAALKEMTAGVVEAWIEQAEAAGLPGAQMVEDARAMVAEASD